MINHEPLRTMDCVCTSSSAVPGKLIRLGTAHLKGFNPFREMFRLFISNHLGYIVQHSGRYWIAEMLGTGLQINSLKNYTRDERKNRITRIVRLPIFDSQEARDKANAMILELAYKTIPYDWRGSPGAFLGLCGHGPEEWYCSEMVENVANMFGGTWDSWQLNRMGKKERIAPVEIEYGKNAITVTGWR
jgi:hypothetical protein